jgi:hypothetical protein
MSISYKSTVHPNRWITISLLALALWLGGSLMIDGVMMPTMYATGMMSAPDFASAGYSMFWIVNRVELLLAAVVISSILLLSQAHIFKTTAGRWAIALASTLITVSLLQTYVLSPALSQMGLQLDLFASVTVPQTMTILHEGYFVLEMLKFLAGGALLAICYQQHNKAEHV